MPAQPDLSVCMIVKNEAHHLAEALASFQPFADEIVVVDTGSNDGTMEIARRFTPHVYHFPWVDDFAAARNHSLDRATGRYILWLDADDRFEPRMQERLRSLKAGFDGKKGFYLLLENVHENEPASFCYQLRCVPLRDDIRFEGRIHEQLLHSATMAGLELATTDITVRHLGYMDRGLCMSKMERNLSLLQKDLDEGRDDVSIHFFVALTHAALGRDSEALKSMEIAVRKMEEQGFDRHALVEGYLFLGRIHEKRNDHARLIRAITRAAALVDDCTSHRYQLGVLYQKLGRHAQAAACLEMVLQGRYSPSRYPSKGLPREGEIRLILAYSLFCMDKHSEAMEQMRRAWNLGLPMCEGWERLGFMALVSDRPGLALHAYEAAERTGKLSADGCCNLGTLYRKQGFTEKALRCYHAALAMSSMHASTIANLGHLHLRSGNWGEARELFLRLPQSGGADPDILLSLVLIAAKQGNRKEVLLLHARLLEAPLFRAMEDTAAMEDAVAVKCAAAEEHSLGEYYRRLALQLEAGRSPNLAAIAREIAQTLARENGAAPAVR